MKPNFREQRSAMRSRVFFGGEIQVDSQLPVIECHVKNVSQGGASIMLNPGSSCQMNLISPSKRPGNDDVEWWRGAGVDSSA